MFPNDMAQILEAMGEAAFDRRPLIVDLLQCRQEHTIATPLVFAYSTTELGPSYSKMCDATSASVPAVHCLTDLAAVRCARPGDLAGKKAPAGAIAANASAMAIMVVVTPIPMYGTQHAALHVRRRRSQRTWPCIVKFGGPILKQPHSDRTPRGEIS